MVVVESIVVDNVNRPISAADEEAGFMIDQVIVKYSAPPSPETIRRINDTFDFETQIPLPDLGIYLIPLPSDGEAILGLIDALENDPEIESASANTLTRPQSIPDFQSVLLRLGWDYESSISFESLVIHVMSTHPE